MKAFLRELKELLAPLGVFGGAVLVVVSLLLTLAFWLVILVAIPLWVPIHAVLTSRGRRGFIITRDGRHIGLSFSLDAFKKVR